MLTRHGSPSGAAANGASVSCVQPAGAAKPPSGARQTSPCVGSAEWYSRMWDGAQKEASASRGAGAGAPEHEAFMATELMLSTTS